MVFAVAHHSNELNNTKFLQENWQEQFQKKFINIKIKHIISIGDTKHTEIPQHMQMAAPRQLHA